MSLLFAASLLASAATTVPNCSWDKPGLHPFMGDVVASVDQYGDIPVDVRAKLKQRMAARQYDELVTIRRDAIVGQQQYDPQIRDMHFGDGRVCRTVSRTKWTNTSQERGLVYCESGQCLLVPTVCRNLSRITRVQTDQGTGRRGPGGGGNLGSGESAGGTALTFAGASSPLRDGLDAIPRSGGSQVASDAVGGSARPNGVPAEPPLNVSYPTVQGPVGTISLVPPFTPAVPEPPAAWMWLVGATALAAARRYRAGR